MTEETSVDLVDCLKPALAVCATEDPQLARFAELLDPVEAEKLACCVATPQGRAFLSGGINTPEGRAWLGLPDRSEPEEGNEIQVNESDILRWAFTAELMQLGIPAPKALSLVDQGITLRDIQFKPVEALAERRWKLAARLVGAGVPVARDVAEALGEPELEAHLDEHWLQIIKKVLARADLPQQRREKLLKQRLEALVKGWLGDRFKELRSQAEKAEGEGQRLLAVSFYDVLVVSDFHLAAGNYPSPDGLARLSPTEDFYFDDAFFRYLFYCEGQRRDRKGYPYELVFNGDVIDFAQVVVSGEQDGALQFWAVPPLWLRNPESDGEPVGQDNSLPGRLLKILKTVYDEGICSDILDQQGDIRNKAGLTVYVRHLTDKEQVLERSATERRRRFEGGPWAPDDAGRTEEWDRREAEDRQQLEAQWEALAEKGWEALAEEERLAPRPVEFDHIPLGIVVPRSKDLPARPQLEERVEERWEAWADEAWLAQAVRERTGREMRQQRVRRMGRKEALGQLADVYFGHRRFFQGLAWFLAQGNRLVIIRGNHDPHWYWPEVQLAFVGWLRTAYDELRRICKNPAGQELPVDLEMLKPYLSEQIDLADFEAQVDFDYGWYYHREGLAYLEHGGQYDAVNAYRFFLHPVCSTSQSGAPDSAAIRQSTSPPKVTEWLPALEVGTEEEEIMSAWGNVGMPLVNLLEIELPNFDRPGYKKVYLDWLLYRQPRLLFQKLGKALLSTGRAMWRWMTHGPDQAVKERHEAKRLAYAKLTGLSSECARELDETRWVKNWRRPGYILSVGRRVIPAVVAVVVALIVLVVLAAQADETSKLSLIWSLISAPVTYWATTLLLGWLNLGEDYLLRPAQDVERILKRYEQDVPYILFGHDHAHNAQQLPKEGWYLNTGTWMHMYETQRKRLLREVHEYPFVRMTDTHHVLARDQEGDARPQPRVELLRWNDEAERVEPCETFRGADEVRGQKEEGGADQVTVAGQRSSKAEDTGARPDDAIGEARPV